MVDSVASNQEEEDRAVLGATEAEAQVAIQVAIHPTAQEASQEHQDEHQAAVAAAQVDLRAAEVEDQVVPAAEMAMAMGKLVTRTTGTSIGRRLKTCCPGTDAGRRTRAFAT